MSATQSARVTAMLALVGRPRTTGRYAGAQHTVYSAARECGINLTTAYAAAARAELRRRLECYRGLLGAYAQSIEAEINKADGELLAKLAAPLALAA